MPNVKYCHKRGNSFTCDMCDQITCPEKYKNIEDTKIVKLGISTATNILFSVLGFVAGQTTQRIRLERQEREQQKQQEQQEVKDALNIKLGE